VRKTETNSISYLILAPLIIMSYFIYTDLISSLLDPRLIDPGSAFIYVGAYGPTFEW